MAIQIVASVGKKVGQPNFGSKSFNLSCTKEVTDLGHLQTESAKLYVLLEQIIEAQIDKEKRKQSNTTDEFAPINRIKTSGINADENGEAWHCSDKQRDLILKLIADHSLEEVAEQMSREMFGGLAIKSLSKLQASGLIQRILQGRQSKGKDLNGRYMNGAVL